MPLVKIRGQWMQFDSEAIEEAIKYWKKVAVGKLMLVVLFKWHSAPRKYRESFPLKELRLRDGLEIGYSSLRSLPKWAIFSVNIHRRPSGERFYSCMVAYPKKQRDRMVERFQMEENGPLVFLLSLKAAGTGLNLTRANHVFHYDRWWNPAVENQATDRAFRIGQSRHVQVYKFVCTGTVEEHINEMIEKKQEVADSVVATGEKWITEMTTRDLKKILRLQKQAVES